MIRPLSDHVLLKIIPETHTPSGLELPKVTIGAEEMQFRARRPEPPPPLTCQIVAIGPWKRLKNGMAVPPPFSPESKVLIRKGSGKDLSLGTTDKLKMVRMDDILAVISDD